MTGFTTSPCGPDDVVGAFDSGLPSGSPGTTGGLLGAAVARVSEVAGEGGVGGRGMDGWGRARLAAAETAVAADVLGEVSFCEAGLVGAGDSAGLGSEPHARKSREATMQKRMER